ncbi:hypothetical protein MKK70_16800 [Methylobacterium sp. E-041]|uniref:HipA family kinase n=1 Tax=Methylobacterium sp. E-041 TaxID=2836573 RepID=UPI001FBA1FD5|nr:HipA family kinase [Methylobacterium sp. E-041]MCJ2107006.1 hypothetical protein [Methylobacterium sp. E-041]
MLARVRPVDFVRVSPSGRTQPVILTCEKQDGDNIDVIAKFSAFCDEGVSNLIREVIAACLAGDLGLPLPEPVLIEIDDQWVSIIPDASLRARIAASARVAFGSKFAGPQFTAWSTGTTLLDIHAPLATAVFAFDGITQNVDRRSDNPNCLVRGDAIRIIDHELAFTHGLVIGWRPPWAQGGLRAMETPGYHIFRAGLRGRQIDFGPIRAAWVGLSDGRIDSYAQLLPPEWAAGAGVAAAAVALIKEARDNIDACLTEVQRVLA